MENGGRERYILHLGEDHDKGLGMDSLVKIQVRLRNGLFDHVVFISGLVQCFNHRVFIMELTR